LIAASQLTDPGVSIGYRAAMQQMDFYFHEGCLSHRSINLLVSELQRDYPAWHIAIHPLGEDEAKAMGFHVLPAIVTNGKTMAIGLPKKDWLLEKMKECERANRR
jgi:hypothetical protein